MKTVDRRAHLKFKKPDPQRRTLQSRSGIAATEFAVIAPVIAIIFVGSISAMAQISLRRNLQLVAYTAAAEVSNTSYSLADIESHYEGFATDIGIRDSDISISVHDGRIYLVEATAPQSTNNPISTPGSAATLTARCYVYR